MKKLTTLLFLATVFHSFAQPKILEPSFDTFGDEITLYVSSENADVSYFLASIEYYDALNDGCGSDASGGIPDITEYITLNRVGTTNIFSGTGLYFTYQEVHIRIRFQGMDSDDESVSGEIALTGLASCGCFDNTIDDLNDFFDSQTMQVGGGNTFVAFNAGANPEYTQYYFKWTYPSDWEMTDYKGYRATFELGDEFGEVSVRAVNPCSGEESNSISYFVIGDQTISFDALSPVTYGDASFDLSATATSGLPVTFQSSNTSVATISGNTVTIVGAGTTTITAQQSGDASYNAAPDIEQTLTINKASQTIAFGSLSDIKYTDDPLLLSATTSSGLPVSFESSDEGIVSIDGNEATAVDVGTVTITASQAGSSNYNAAASINQNLTVQKGDQTIDFDEITGDYTVNNSSFAISADASSLLTVTFSSSNEEVATISGSIVNIQGGGETTITAHQAGNSLYNAAPDVSQTVTISKLSQTVNVPDLSDNLYVYGGSAGAFQVYNSSGLEEMEFESSDESVFTIQNIANAGSGYYYITLGIVGTGTATFTATQPGNEEYESASGSTEITVSKDNQFIEFFSLSPVFFDDDDFELSATAESGLTVTFASSDPSIASVSGTTVMIHNAGEVTITASQSGNENYNAATDVPQTLTVMKRVQTISFNTDLPQYATFGEGPYSINPTASSGLPVTLSIDDESVVMVDNGTATIVGAGTATITANQAGNQNYHSKEGNITVEVEQASQTITFDPLVQKNYGDTPFELTAGSTSGLSITYSSGDESVATIDGNTVTIVGAGSTWITANQSGNDNYYAASQKGQTLTVNKGDQEITFDGINDQEVGGILNLSATATSGLEVFYEISGPATLSGTEVTMNNIGTVTVTASQDGNANYNSATDVTRSFEIVEEKLDQTISFDPIGNVTYGDIPFMLNANASSGLTVSYESSNEAVATVVGSSVTIIGAGTTTITASQAGNDDFDAAEDVEHILTVNKADQTLSFDLGANATKTFGDDSFSADAISSSGLAVVLNSSNTSVASIDDGAIEINGAGTAIITASQPGDVNYNTASPIEQILMVNKAVQSIIFDPSTISDQVLSDGSITLDIYGDPHSEGDLSVEISNGPASISETGPDFYEVIFSGAGEVVIEVVITETENYTSVTEQLSFTVINDLIDDQTITFSALEEKTFGDASFELAATASSGLVVSYSSSNESVATISGNTVTIVGAGTTTITASQEGNSEYLSAEDVEQILVVNKADQTITFSALEEKTFGDASFELAATASSGLMVNYSSSDESVATISGNEVSILGAGSTTITAFQAGNENYYSAEDVEQILVVNKIDQTITFEALSEKTYEDEPFVLSASISSGLDISFSSSDESIAIIDGNEVTILAAGTVAITASQDGNDNYEPAESVSQELVINKAAQIITFGLLDDMIVGEEVSLSATASSGLGVSFEVSGPVTLDGNTLTAIGEGAVSVTAFQEGNDNYNPAESISHSFEVSEDNITGIADGGFILYPNPAQHFILIKNLVGEESVTLVDINGKIILSQTINSGAKLDLQGVKDGIYFIKLKNHENNLRVVIRR